tara:strand:- start:987 stop:1430 length:444 start_codon:yes stop_codon:yes gene_type:complete
MAFDSNRDINQSLATDFLEIAIEQMGRDVYNGMSPQAKRKLKTYNDNMATAVKYYLQRQTFNITQMDAPVVIPSINPWLPPGAPPQVFSTLYPIPSTPAAVPPGAVISLGTPLFGRSQISEDQNRIGQPQVNQNVKKSKVRLLEPED